MITIDEYPATSLREYESRFQELTTENNRLRSENLEWLARQHENEQRLQQIERAKYLAVQQENAARQLTKTVLCQRDHYQQMYQKKEEECQALFRSLHIDRHRTSRQLIEHEIVFANSINQLKQGIYDSQLEDKNNIIDNCLNDIDTLMRENNKLKTALIDSTTEYQDIIFKLKEEKVKAEISLQQSHAADAHLKGRTTPNLLEEAKCWNLQQQLAVANEAIAKLQHKMMSMNQQHRSQLQTFRVNINLTCTEALQAQNRQLMQKNQQIIGKYSMLTAQYPEIVEHQQDICNFVERYNEVKKKEDLLYSLQLQSKKATAELKQVSTLCKKQAKQLAQLKSEKTVNETKHVQLLKHLQEQFIKINPYFDIYKFSLLELRPDEITAFTSASDNLQLSLIQLADLNKRLQGQIGELKHECNMQTAKLLSEQQTNAAMKLEYQSKLADNNMLQTQLNLLRERLILVEQKSGKQKLKELEDDLEYSEDEAEAQLRRDFETIRCNVLEAAFKELQEDRVLLVRTIQQKEFELVQCYQTINGLQQLQNFNFVLSEHMPTVAPIPAFVNANIHHGSNDRCKHQSSNRNNQHILLANSIEELNHKVEDALSYNLKSNELLVAEHETKVAALQVKIDTLIQQNKALLAANDTLQDKLHFESFKNQKCPFEDLRFAQRSFEQIQLQDIGLGESAAAQADGSNQANLIGQSTIRNLEEMLRKYDKQINSMMQQYELVHATLEAKIHRKEHKLLREGDQTQKGLLICKPLIQKLREQMGEKEQQNIQLVASLRAADLQYRLLKEDYSKEIDILKATLAQQKESREKLQQGLREIQAHVSKQNIEGNQAEDFPGTQEKAFQTTIGMPLTVIAAKNQEISRLEQACQEANGEIARLRNQLSQCLQSGKHQASPLETIEQSQLRKCIQNDELPQVLQLVLERLQNDAEYSEEQVHE